MKRVGNGLDIIGHVLTRGSENKNKSYFSQWENNESHVSYV